MPGNGRGYPGFPATEPDWLKADKANLRAERWPSSGGWPPVEEQRQGQEPEKTQRLVSDPKTGSHTWEGLCCL